MLLRARLVRLPLAAAAATLFIVALPAVARPGASQQAARPSAGLASGERFKNIQVLKDLPADQLHDAMTYMAATTGGNCSTCHVRDADGEWAYEKDDSDRKTAARSMIQMVRAINAQHFKGEERVNCATCHQGRREPSPVQALAQPLTADQLAIMAERGAGRQGPPPAAPGQPGAGRGAGAPPPAGRGAQRPSETVDQVLDKYLEALGGRDAIAKVATRIRRGTVTNRAGQSSPVTIEETAAGRVRVTMAAAVPVSRASDGAAGWVQSGERVRELDHVESVNAALQADQALGLRIRENYTALAVRAYDRVNGKAVVTVDGRRPGVAVETLYFDRASGLLVRRTAQLRTPLGPLPVQIDYDDYRAVDAVQTPFSVRVTDWESVSSQTFSDVVHNQPIDAARFAAPAAK